MKIQYRHASIQTDSTAQSPFHFTHVYLFSPPFSSLFLSRVWLPRRVDRLALETKKHCGGRDDTQLAALAGFREESCLSQDVCTEGTWQLRCSFMFSFKTAAVCCQLRWRPFWINVPFKPNAVVPPLMCHAFAFLLVLLFWCCVTFKVHVSKQVFGHWKFSFIVCTSDVIASAHRPVWIPPLQLSELSSFCQFLISLPVAFVHFDFDWSINWLADWLVNFLCLLWHQTESSDWSCTVSTSDLSLPWHHGVTLATPVSSTVLRPQIKTAQLPSGSSSGDTTNNPSSGPGGSGTDCLGKNYEDSIHWRHHQFVFSVCGAHRTRLPLHSGRRQALSPWSHSCSTSVPQFSPQWPYNSLGKKLAKCVCARLVWRPVRQVKFCYMVITQVYSTLLPISLGTEVMML